MTPYHETFLPILLLGCLVAGVLSILAGIRAGSLLSRVLLLGGVVIVWVALFVGSDLGYRAWQSMPDPPDEAFSDASVLGALVLGWVPGVLYCSSVFLAVQGLRWFLYWANSDVFPAAALPAEQQPLKRVRESGNPYQSPLH